MKFKNEYFLFAIAFVIKVLLHLVITTNINFLLIHLGFIAFMAFMIIKKYNVYTYIPVVMVDFIIQSLFCFETFGYEFTSLIVSLISFLLGSGFLYSLIINNCGKLHAKKVSNINVDKGIKALENNDYNLAIESFSNAIKEHRRNYLGYMGMCNTLTKMDKKNLKKIAYYKKKCIKYAPKELKDSINNRY